ncbi:Na/Pi symporter [Corynebacterium sp. H130]|uniref:Na/Pi symporter n=1 Tax=Corynebacterium sp. H130 TaxID=3133444 RepID=UPI00309A6926
MSTHTPKLYFPGTVHYINPLHSEHDEDAILISEFGRAVRWVGIALCIYVLVVAINLINNGIHILGYDAVHNFVGTINHPILAVLAGVLFTFTVQSSTVVTTLTVATVGAGIVPLDMAVMLIMGSNVGTCAASQIVAFGFYRNACNLHRAVAAAMTHWWFNVLSLLVLFPIELIFHPLSRLSGALSTRLYDADGHAIDADGLVGHFVRPVSDALSSGIDQLFHPLSGTLTLTLGVFLIVLTIHYIAHLMQDLTASGSHHMLENSTHNKVATAPIRSTLAGLGLTMMSQSSSATICSALPFAGTGNLAIRRFLGIVLGANLGTTLTAVLTAFAFPGEHGELALQAALIHVLFNLIGIIAVLSAKPVSRTILTLSEKTAGLAGKQPFPAFLCIIASYTLIPLAILSLSTL